VLLAGKQIYLICENGGSLENKPGTMFGFQSRWAQGKGWLVFELGAMKGLGVASNQVGRKERMGVSRGQQLRCEALEVRFRV
jgi:hypothetical protein